MNPQDRELMERAADEIERQHVEIEAEFGCGNDYTAHPLVGEIRTYLSAPAEPPSPHVQVPDAEGLALVAYAVKREIVSEALGRPARSEWDTLDDIDRDEFRRIALAVARACLAPIVEARRVHREAVEAETRSIRVVPGEQLATERALDALLTTIDTLAGRT